MCGRYVFVSEPRELKSDFPDLEIISQSQPKTNISPGQDISVVRKKKTHILSSMRWGLIPSWAKDHAGTFKTFNARSETITEKPTFRTPFKKKRCLIPFNGFYEWKERTIRKLNSSLIRNSKQKRNHLHHFTFFTEICISVFLP